MTLYKFGIGATMAKKEKFTQNDLDIQKINLLVTALNKWTEKTEKRLSAVEKVAYGALAAQTIMVAIFIFAINNMRG